MYNLCYASSYKRWQKILETKSRNGYHHGGPPSKVGWRNRAISARTGKCLVCNQIKLYFPMNINAEYINRWLETTDNPEEALTTLCGVHTAQTRRPIPISIGFCTPLIGIGSVKITITITNWCSPSHTVTHMFTSILSSVWVINFHTFRLTTCFYTSKSIFAVY